MFSDDIDISDYIYCVPIYITETSGSRILNHVVEVTLTSDNFNFGLARSDGNDLRFGLRSNGTGILNMWISSWDLVSETALVWVSIPEILPYQTLTLWVYFGNDDDEGISDIEPLDFLFKETFSDTITDSTGFVNQCVGGTADASNTYSTDYPSKAFDGIFDSGGWRCQHSGDGTIRWLSYTFLEPKNITIYLLNVDTTLSPKSWYFQVYVEGENRWVTIDYQFDRVAYTWNSSGRNKFVCSPHNIYSKIYRFYFFGYSDSTDLIIREVEMYEYDGRDYISYGSSVYNSMLSIPYYGVYSPTKLLADDVNSYLYDGYKLTIGFALLSTVTAIYNNYMLLSMYVLSLFFDNDFLLAFYPNDGTIKFRTTMYDGGASYETYDDGDYGVENESYFILSLSYDRQSDNISISVFGRNTLQDFEIETERRVLGNTGLKNLCFYGPRRFNTDTPKSLMIDWIVLNRNINVSMDISNLKIDYEYIFQPYAGVTYGPDVTSVLYRHEGDSGSVYKLSDNVVNNIENIWVNDQEYSSGYLTIDYGALDTNLVDISFVHYDSDHITFYGAAKLSDSDSDVNGNNYWSATTSSGWACINFSSSAKPVGCLMVKAVSGYLDSLPKDFTFEGSFVDPRFSSSDKRYELCSGTFSKSAEKQYVYFNNTVSYKYYILNVLNTYGDTIKLQEWGMYEYSYDCKKMNIRRICLYPVKFGGNEWYYPKTISFVASNDGITWTTLIHSMYTYTPFFDNDFSGRQDYAFENEYSYYQYKLIYSNNWYGSGNKIMIADWEMNELPEEENTYRVLDLDYNSVSNIWADQECDFDSGIFFVAGDSKINYISDNVLVKSIQYDSTIHDFILL